MGILLETFMGGLLVFLVTWTIREWRRPTPQPRHVLGMQRSFVASPQDFVQEIHGPEGVLCILIVHGEPSLGPVLSQAVEQAMLDWRRHIAEERQLL